MSRTFYEIVMEVETTGVRDSDHLMELLGMTDADLRRDQRARKLARDKAKRDIRKEWK